MDALLIPTAVNTLKGSCSVIPSGYPRNRDFRFKMSGLAYITISDGKNDRHYFSDPEETLRNIKAHLDLNHYVDILAEDIDWTGQGKMTLRSRDCYVLIRTDYDRRLFPRAAPSFLADLHPITVLETEISLR